MNSPDIFLLLIICLGFAISTVICHNLTQLSKDLSKDVTLEESKQRVRLTNKPSKTYNKL